MMLLNERSELRMTRRQVLRTGAAASLAALGAGALSVADTRQAAAAPQGKILSVAMLLNINTLDPGRTLENATNNVDHVCYDALTTFQGEDLKTDGVAGRAHVHVHAAAERQIRQRQPDDIGRLQMVV
jgi:hypothetical protein